MFLSDRYRPNKWPFIGLVLLEFPITVALLALFGIASPNLYRTRLWQDGADNGFNSNPNTGLYAAANYRPYTTPKVWSQFITDFNVVISVLSMFFMLVKAVMYVLHVWPPIVSAVIHAALITLYTVSMTYQAGSDTSDPQHPQRGAPWYITKSCSVAHNPNNIHYCIQAKAAFACTCVMLGIFLSQLVLALFSCVPSKSYREEYSEKRAAKAARKSRYDALNSPTAMSPETPGPQSASGPRTTFDHVSSPNAPNTPGTTGGIKSPTAPILNPMTPRTLAFNRLGGTKDLPMRNHFSTPNAPKSPTYALQSPDFPRSPLSPGFARAEANADAEMGRAAGAEGGMYFPPPPKVATK